MTSRILLMPVHKDQGNKEQTPGSTLRHLRFCDLTTHLKRSSRTSEGGAFEQAALFPGVSRKEGIASLIYNLCDPQFGRLGLAALAANGNRGTVKEYVNMGFRTAGGVDGGETKQAPSDASRSCEINQVDLNNAENEFYHKKMVAKGWGTFCGTGVGRISRK